jgi:hypothetical protein
MDDNNNNRKDICNNNIVINNGDQLNDSDAVNTKLLIQISSIDRNAEEKIIEIKTETSNVNQPTSITDGSSSIMTEKIETLLQLSEILDKTEINCPLNMNISEKTDFNDTVFNYDKIIQSQIYHDTHDETVDSNINYSPVKETFDLELSDDVNKIKSFDYSTSKNDIENNVSTLLDNTRSYTVMKNKPDQTNKYNENLKRREGKSEPISKDKHPQILGCFVTRSSVNDLIKYSDKTYYKQELKYKKRLFGNLEIDEMSTKLLLCDWWKPFDRCQEKQSLNHKMNTDFSIFQNQQQEPELKQTTNNNLITKTSAFTKNSLTLNLENDYSSKY